MGYIGPIALIAFWGLAIKLWIVDGPKLPLIFFGLWLVGRLGFRPLGISGFLFVPFEALLAVGLLLIVKYKEVT